jgi:hypothetical protein
MNSFHHFDTKLLRVQNCVKSQVPSTSIEESPIFFRGSMARPDSSANTHFDMFQCSLCDKHSSMSHLRSAMTINLSKGYTRKSLVLLNFNRQLLWYLALLPIRVASIPVPSSKSWISIGAQQILILTCFNVLCVINILQCLIWEAQWLLTWAKVTRLCYNSPRRTVASKVKCWRYYCTRVFISGSCSIIFTRWSKDEGILNWILSAENDPVNFNLCFASLLVLISLSLPCTCV